MPKAAISVTLDVENITWLKGRAKAAGIRSVSELLDRIVGAARESGRIGPSRSVVGSIDIASSDPLLEGADAAVREQFDGALGRTARIAEPQAAYRVRRTSRKRSG
jgi:hypothetical protein